MDIVRFVVSKNAQKW